MPADLTREETEGLQVLKVRGRLSLDDLEDFEEHLESIQRSRVDGVVDLLDCPFLASRVFPSLLKASQAMKAGGHKLFIACPDDLYRILEVLRLNQHLTVHPTFEDCMKAARATS